MTDFPASLANVKQSAAAFFDQAAKTARDFSLNREVATFESPSSHTKLTVFMGRVEIASSDGKVMLGFGMADLKGDDEARKELCLKVAEALATAAGLPEAVIAEPVSDDDAGLLAVLKPYADDGGFGEEYVLKSLAKAGFAVVRVEPPLAALTPSEVIARGSEPFFADNQKADMIGHGDFIVGMLADAGYQIVKKE